MNAIDADGARSFEGLSAREAQEALAEELQAAMDVTETEEAMGPEQEARPEETAAQAPAEVLAPREWTPEELFAHERMAEALLFAAAEPLDEASIAARLPAGADIPALLAALSERYQGRGVVLSKIAGRWRFTTAVDVAPVLETERVEQRRLSRAALETLAIIAYHQPCTRADIEDVRGVAVSKGSLDQLLEIGWVRLRGRRRDAPGRPVLYATTQAFLEHFGLESVGDLPGMADLRAAGLLDARLPAGFSVPTPSDAGEEPGDEDGEEEAGEFARDFLDEEASAGE